MSTPQHHAADIQQQLTHVIAVTTRHWNIASVNVRRQPQRTPFRCSHSTPPCPAPPDRALGLTWQWSY